MDALLVIDIDGMDGWCDIEKLPDDRKKVAHAIVQELEEWRKRKALVVFIVLLLLNKERDQVAQVVSHKARPVCIVCDGLPREDRLAPFLEHRHGEEFEPAFIKTSCDAFLNEALAEFLRKRGVTRVFLAGCSMGACIDETARGALRNGISVVLLRQCVYPQISSASYPATEEAWIAYVISVDHPPDATVEII